MTRVSVDDGLMRQVLEVLGRMPYCNIAPLMDALKADIQQIPEEERQADPAAVEPTPTEKAA